MRRWLARLIVHLSARLAPRDLRARWKEEWLAEIASVENDTGCRFSNRAPGEKRHPVSFSVLARAFGAPWDALAARRLPTARGERRRLHLGQWWADTRYTVRLLARSPGYVAVATLGLGAGLTATITMYSAANSALHGELPGIADRESLARVDPYLASSDPSTARLEMATRGDFEILRHHGPRVLDVAAQGHAWVNVRVGTDVDNVRAAFASPSLFQMLGTRAAVGRLLGSADDRPDADTVVIGTRLWSNRFGGRPDAIGTPVRIGDRSMRVVGVVPDRFEGIEASWRAEAYVAGTTEIWLPLALARGWPGASDYVSIAARLAPGATRADARTDFAPLGPALEAAHPAPGRRATIRVWDLVFGYMVESVWNLSGIVLALLAFPLAVLVIACANVANLRLARAMARGPEWAVRISLGATHGQLVRLLLIEAVLLTALSLFVAWIGVRLVIAQFGSRYLASTVIVDWRVALFSTAIAGAAVVLSGLAPAWLTMRRATVTGLKQAAASGGPAHSRLRSTLVVVQIAVSLALIALGSLFTRSVQLAESARIDSFDRLITAELRFRKPVYDAPRAATFMAALMPRLEADSRFSAVGLSDSRLGEGRVAELLPLSTAGDNRRWVSVAAVTPGWFAAMSLPPLVGRTLTARDAPSVAVINEAVARTIAPAGSPIGVSISLRSYGSTMQTSSFEIVGVVADTTRAMRDQRKAVSFVYTPLPEPAPTEVSIFAREGRPVDLVPALRTAIADVDPIGPWTMTARASAWLDQQSSPQRGLAVAINIIGAVALTLAAAGLFAVMAYAVSLRTREIGVRLALGARPLDINRLILVEALRLAAIGAAAGFAIAVPLAQSFRALFLGISPIDPVALGGVALLLAATAFVAGALPARRAAAVDPVKALRAE